MGQGMSRKEFLAEYKKIEEDKERNAAQREMRQRELAQQAIATLSRNQLQAEMNNLREELRQAERWASRQQQQANMNMMRGGISGIGFLCQDLCIKFVVDNQVPHDPDSALGLPKNLGIRGLSTSGLSTSPLEIHAFPVQMGTSC